MINANQPWVYGNYIFSYLSHFIDCATTISVLKKLTSILPISKFVSYAKCSHLLNLRYVSYHK